MKAKATIARRTINRGGLVLAAASAVLLTASCAAGQHAATADETPAIDGTGAVVGSMHLAGVALEAPAVSCHLPGSDVALTLVIVNGGTAKDTLDNVSSPRFKSALVAANSDDAAAFTAANPGSGSCAPKPGSTSSTSAPLPPSQPLPSPAGPQTITAGQSLQLGVTNTGTDSSTTNPVVVLTGLTGQPLYAGEAIPVTFSFAKAGAVTLTVPVQLNVAPNNSTVPAAPNTGGE